MKQHLSVPLDKMSKDQEQYLTNVINEAAERIISRYSNNFNVLLGISLKVKEAAFRLKAKEAGNADVLPPRSSLEV